MDVDLAPQVVGVVAMTHASPKASKESPHRSAPIVYRWRSVPDAVAEVNSRRRSMGLAARRTSDILVRL
jgi:hypothetical protein